MAVAVADGQITSSHHVDVVEFAAECESSSFRIIFHSSHFLHSSHLPPSPSENQNIPELALPICKFWGGAARSRDRGAGLRGLAHGAAHAGGGLRGERGGQLVELHGRRARARKGARDRCVCEEEKTHLLVVVVVVEFF